MIQVPSVLIQFLVESALFFRPFPLEDRL